MSWRRYTSRTIFWTLPLLVDLTYTLLEMLCVNGSAPAVRLRLAILIKCSQGYGVKLRIAIATIALAPTKI